MFNAPTHAAFDAWTSEEVTRRWFHAGHKARLGRCAERRCEEPAPPMAEACQTGALNVLSQPLSLDAGPLRQAAKARYSAE
jgi:hypothetical protein